MKYQRIENIRYVKQKITSDSKTLNETKSLCPICLKKIDATIKIKNKKVVIFKECPKHGKFEYPHAWDDPFLYRKIFKLSKNRVICVKDTTVDITSRCNMSCPFCFSFLRDTSHYEPSVQALMDNISKLENSGGEIILYGGEPTLREDLCDIVRSIKKLGLNVGIATNGLELNKSKISDLDKAGLDRIQLQFDSMDDDIYESMRGKRVLEDKLRVIYDTKDTDMDVTLFVVLIKGVNDDQIAEILSFAIKNPENIRSIIFTTVSPEGKKSFKASYISNKEILSEVYNGFGITKKDFIECTGFDLALSNFIYEFIRIRRRSPSSCELLCYVYIMGSRIIPFSRLMDLNESSKLLNRLVKEHKQGCVIKPKTLFQIIYNIKRIRVSPTILPILFRALSSIVFFSLSKRRTSKKFKNTFGIVIAPSQNRYNIDCNLNIKDCNLYSSNDNGEQMSFCERLILLKGPERG